MIGIVRRGCLWSMTQWRGSGTLVFMLSPAFNVPIDIMISWLEKKGVIFLHRLHLENFIPCSKNVVSQIMSDSNINFESKAVLKHLNLKHKNILSLLDLAEDNFWVFDLIMEKRVVKVY